MGTRFKCNEETTVQTKQGLLKGFYYDGIYAFHAYATRGQSALCRRRPQEPGRVSGMR